MGQDSEQDQFLVTDVSTTHAEAIFRDLKMASARVVETSVTNNSPSKDFNHPVSILIQTHLLVIPLAGKKTSGIKPFICIFFIFVAHFNLQDLAQSSSLEHLHP